LDIHLTPAYDFGCLFLSKPEDKERFGFKPEMGKKKKNKKKDFYRSV
jgi:hypothetical protein